MLTVDLTTPAEGNQFPAEVIESNFATPSGIPLRSVTIIDTEAGFNDPDRPNIGLLGP